MTIEGERQPHNCAGSEAALLKRSRGFKRGLGFSGVSSEGVHCPRGALFQHIASGRLSQVVNKINTASLSTSLASC